MAYKSLSFAGRQRELKMRIQGPSIRIDPLFRQNAVFTCFSEMEMETSTPLYERISLGGEKTSFNFPSTIDSDSLSDEKC